VVQQKLCESLDIAHKKGVAKKTNFQATVVGWRQDVMSQPLPF
jgi:hypothetical protein